jgi:hypothetical protein
MPATKKIPNPLPLIQITPTIQQKKSNKLQN